MRYKIFSGILCLLLCMLLPGCASRPADSVPGTGDSAAGPVEDLADWEDLGQVSTQPLIFLSEDTDTGFGDRVRNVEPFVAAGGRLWSTGANTEYRPGTSGYQLLSMLPDGSDPTITPLQYPAFPMDELYGVAIYTTDHLALLAGAEQALYSLDVCVKTGQANDPTDDRYYYFLSTVDAAGQSQDPRPLPVPDTSQSVGDLRACLAGEVLYLPTTDGVWLLSAQGEPRLLSCEANTAPVALAPAADGSLLAVLTSTYTDSNGFTYTVGGSYRAGIVDAATGVIKGARALPETVYGYSTRPVAGLDGTLWLWDDTGISRLDLENAAAEPVCHWVDSGIDAATVLQLLPQADGSFLLLSQESAGAPLLLSTLRKADAAHLAGRTVITFGILQQDDAIKKAVLAFNRAHDDIYVQLVDYAAYNTEATNYWGGVQMLHRDILNNAAPDVLTLPYVDERSLLNKGVFLDLGPLLDADKELSRDDLSAGMLQSCAFGDTLPAVMPTYNISTLVGAASLVGDTPGWTFAEFEEFMQQHPATLPIIKRDRTLLLEYLVSYGGRSLVDYDAGTCRLDGEEMAIILEHCAAYPADTQTDVGLADWPDQLRARFTEGESLLLPQDFGGFADLRSCLYTFDGPVTLIGYPTADGSGGSGLQGLRMGISAGSAHPEAAWKFLRSLLLPDAQRRLCASDYGGLPANRQVLQELADAQRVEQADSPYANLPGAQAMVRPLTDAEIDQLLQLAQQTSFAASSLADPVIQIVLEEAEAFFAGQRSARETGEIIQDRVQTYLDEQG